MTSYLASRLASVKPSASAMVSESAKLLKAGGQDVIDLGLGEPDFDTPAFIVEAACTAARQGQTRYPPTAGTAQLKSAIAAKFARDNKLEYSAAELIVSNGAKQIIFDALMASMEPGQEVILCAPYFGSYADIVLVQSGVPKVVQCSAEQNFKMTPADLAQALSPQTRWLFLNSPSNPSGAVYSKEEYQALGAVLALYPEVLILSDEIYESILFGNDDHIAFAAACPDLFDRTLTVNGVSKSYAMTGWRIGYGAGPQELIQGMTTVQSQISSGACSVAQAAAAAALNGPQDSVDGFRQEFEYRRDLVVSRIQGIEGLTLDTPGGAFYAYIGCKALIGTVTPDGQHINDDIAFTKYLLEQALVATVPGSAYGLSPFFRISTACSAATLDTAIDRIAVCVERLLHPESGKSIS